MALNFTSDIMSLFNSNIATDADYQAPGNFGLTTSLTGAVGVDHVTIDTVGTYTTVPTATPSSGAATFTTRMKLRSASAIAAAGTGYTPTNVLSLSGGVKTTTATITVATVKLVSASIPLGGGGTGYGAASTFDVTVAGANITPATINVTTDGTGVVTLINSVSAAGSYSTLPTLTSNPVTGDDGVNHGSNLALNLVFGVNTFTLSNAGVYTALPSNPISVTGGSGAGFTLTGSWSVDSLVVTNGGAYETVAPTLTFSSGSAAATAVLATSNVATDTKKVLMLVELIRSLIAETHNPSQVKDIHEVLRKMMMVMRFGSPLSFSAANMATNCLNSAMHYIAKNNTHGGASI